MKVKCPPCKLDDIVWGSAIYRSQSPLCTAATHAGKITEKGGQLIVVNNGVYSAFLGSKAHGVNSHTRMEPSVSIRFEDPPKLIMSRTQPSTGAGSMTAVASKSVAAGIVLLTLCHRACYGAHYVWCWLWWWQCVYRCFLTVTGRG